MIIWLKWSSTREICCNRRGLINEKNVTASLRNWNFSTEIENFHLKFFPTYQKRSTHFRWLFPQQRSQEIHHILFMHLICIFICIWTHSPYRHIPHTHIRYTFFWDIIKWPFDCPDISLPWSLSTFRIFDYNIIREWDNMIPSINQYYYATVFCNRS